MAYPQAYKEFFAVFNRGQFWEAHEVLEGLWQHDRNDFYQALILLAGAYVHVTADRAAPARQLFEAALDYLVPYAPACMGLDVGAVLAHIGQCLAALERLQPGDRPSRAVPALQLAPR